MLTKLFTRLFVLTFALQANVAHANWDDQDYSEIEEYGFEVVEKSHHHNYAVLSNQAAVTSGENIPWSPASSTVSSRISVDGLGNITLPKKGLFLVQYTVRLTKSPFNGTATATVQLQQTVSGTPTNISEAAVTTNTSIDGLTNPQPESQTQLTGYALVNVTSTRNNVINLAVSITPSSNISIPQASGTDANAQLVILQLK